MAVYSASYTRTSEVGARVPHAETNEPDEDDPKRKALREATRKLGQEYKQYNELEARFDSEEKQKELRGLYVANLNAYSKKLAAPLTAADIDELARVSKQLGLPLTAADIHERDRRLKEAELKLAHTGHRFEGIDVKVIRGPHKGVHGVVVADHDSAERVKRLGKNRKLGQDRNAKGIMLTVRKEASNQQLLVRIEDAQHL
jgi:hypothetical protein